MIELKELSFSYHGKRVLDKIDFRIEPGKVTVLMGPNGSGKSTLLKVISGILPVEAGVLVDGVELGNITGRELAQKVSYMPQSRNTPNIIVRSMVLHGRFPYLSFPRRYTKADTDAADRALEAVGALDIADCAMPELSGGQRQKVYVAMTLTQDTDTVLMDEPMNFLDIQHQLALVELAHQLANGGKAVLLVMHDIRLAMQTADIVAVLADGKLRTYADAQEVFASGVIDEIFGIGLSRIDTEFGPRYFYI